MKQKNYWIFEILPSGNFLNSFSLGFNNFSIGEDSFAMPLNFLLSSIHFDNKANPQDVYSVASFVVAIINGCTKLMNVDTNEHNSVWLGKLFKNGEVVNENYKCDVDLLSIDNLLNEIPKSNAFLDQAFEEGFIRNLLLYCNEGWNLTNMYKISDDISNFLKSQGDDISNYVLKSDYKAFGATANNFSVSGLQARHGKGNNSKPKRIMNNEEASAFTRNYLKIILKKYFGFELKFIESNEDDFNLETLEF